MSKLQRGFTVIELIFMVTLVTATSILFFVQKHNLQVAARDEQRKVAINAMYYSLEEVFYRQQGYYPQTIDQTALPSVEPALFTDPAGVKIGEANSQYRYEPVDCRDNHCRQYTLRTTLESEADFIKTSRNN